MKMYQLQISDFPWNIFIFFCELKEVHMNTAHKKLWDTYVAYLQNAQEKVQQDN